MALSLRVLGPASFMLFLVPMALLQPAVTRQRRIREAQRQTLVALSRLTDQAGLTTPGHATRVARLAVPVAREAGVDDAGIDADTDAGVRIAARAAIARLAAVLVPAARLLQEGFARVEHCRLPLDLMRDRETRTLQRSLIEEPYDGERR